MVLDRSNVARGSSSTMQLAPGSGEYPGEDGLLRCTCCHQLLTMPVPMFLQSPNRPPYIRVMCQCRQAAFEQSNAQNLASSERPEVQLFPPLPVRFRGCHFESSENNTALQQVEAYTKNWKAMSSEGKNLLLWGAPGTGKTHAAACLANELTRQGFTVPMTSIRSLINFLAVQKFSTSATWLDRYIQADLLILEDLGLSAASDYELSLLFELIDGRYREQKPVVITTCLQPDMLRTVKDLRWNQILSRFLQKYISIRFFCRNYREQQTKKE